MSDANFYRGITRPHISKLEQAKWILPPIGRTSNFEVHVSDGFNAMLDEFKNLKDKEEVQEAIVLVENRLDELKISLIR